MKSSKILIVADQFDLSVDILIVWLREKGHFPVRLNLRDMPLSAPFYARLGEGHPSGKLKLGSRDLSLSDIRSVLWRNSGSRAMAQNLSDETRALAFSETEAGLTDLWNSLDCYWMNFPTKASEADSKAGQLLLASRLGFEVPRTLITSRAEQAILFLEECSGQVVYKPLGGPRVESVAKAPGEKEKPRGRVFYPTLIDRSQLESGMRSISNAPCLFQEYIERKTEYRVTVIGNEVVVAEIQFSQKLRNRGMWLEGQEFAVRRASLPDELASRCIDFVRQTGLEYCGLDIALTDDGRYVFIESNPNAQFFFAEEELHLVETIAARLLEGRRQTAQAGSPNAQESGNPALAGGANSSSDAGRISNGQETA